MNYYKKIKKCRVCDCESLDTVFKIEKQYLSPTFVKTNEGNLLSKVKVPQTLVLCGDCKLLQLKETVDPDLLYKEYFYRTAINDTMKIDLKDLVESCLEEVKPSENDTILDIGANDGTMLSFYPNTLRRVGVEPAENIDWTNVEESITIVNDYFSKKCLEGVLKEDKVKIITSCAMFYDIDKPNKFVQDIKEILHEDGMWCIQLSYLPLMLSNMNFYDICNEHLEYYSLHTLQYLMNKNGLSIFHAEENAVNGGSVKVFISHTEKNSTLTESFKSLYAKEEELELDKPETYVSFEERANYIKKAIGDYIKTEKDTGSLVIGLGASTKGNMLLQFFEIGKETIPFISERNPQKVGLRTMGTDIELISEEAARKLNPSCMLVLPWYFKDEIVKREREYLDRGGKLLMPMPYPHVITKDGETNV